MGNGLGAMAFIAPAFLLGYWVLTGRAGNFLYALKNGQGGTQSGAAPLAQPTGNIPGLQLQMPPLSQSGGTPPSLQLQPYGPQAPSSTPGGTVGSGVFYAG